MKFTIVKTIWQWVAGWFNKQNTVETVSSADAVDERVERIADTVETELQKLTKKQIAAYAEQRGIKVDQRKTKAVMIADIVAAIK